MKFYYNRTKCGIFERDELEGDFYNDFFAKYDIDLAEDVYLHFSDEANMENYMFAARTIYFSKGRIIIFDAKLFCNDKVPYEGYSVIIHKQSDVQSVKIDCTGDHDFPLYRVKIDIGSSLVEFEIKKEYFNAKDCDNAIAYLSKLLETNE